MTATRLVLAACCLAAAWAQSQQQYTTPIPILKQINRQNEDGSYSYGYEGADGSYKIETKHATGEVYGKYGYVDDTGSLREIEYGASKLGFQPAGTGVNVAPPTLPDPNSANYVGPEGEDDGQYREDPSIYWKDPKYNQGVPKSAKPTYSQTSYTNPAYSQNSYSQPAYSQQQPTYTRQQPTYTQQQPTYTQQQPTYTQQQPTYSQQPSYSQFSAPTPRPNTWQRSWNPPAAPVDQNIFLGHPASNIDLYTGSYSVNYK
ncbi:uncharacterized protein LOC128990996 [Macrosteles quadrilineatus]|uniref:uncharacterized protein LOC128990996 n=1 Tax=Macrosteles quadrilineatus TaxID=74068 RepID=UPI0023E30E35|nr:uncharacterized protein LOC128990996 [Macrosteles quadrilineatus]